MKDFDLLALLRELGPVNLARFLQQFETGYGDYTQERHEWLDQYTVEEIAQEIQKGRDAEEGLHPLGGWRVRPQAFL